MPTDLTNLDDIFNGTAADETVFGLEGDDSLNGGGGNDALYGGEGNDYVRGSIGNNSYYGGTGVDYLSLYDATTAVTINLATNVLSGG